MTPGQKKHLPLSFFLTRKNLTVFAVLAGGGIILILLFKPFGGKWAEQSTKIRAKTKLLKKYQALIQSEDKLQKSLDQMTRRVQAQLPAGREESGFLTEIGNVAQETNIHIETMNPLPLRNLGAFRELSVEIDMEANLGNLTRFLYLLRESSAVLAVDTLRLQPKSERSALLKAHLVISTIFMKDK